MEVEFPAFRTHAPVLGHVGSRTRQAQIDDLVPSADIDFLEVLASDAEGVYISFGGRRQRRPRCSHIKVRRQSVAVRWRRLISTCHRSFKSRTNTKPSRSLRKCRRQIVANRLIEDLGQLLKPCPFAEAILLFGSREIDGLCMALVEPLRVLPCG